MVDDYWSQVDDCWFIVSSCCWRKDFSNTLWFFMISDILSGSSFTNVLRVLVKILTHFVLVMSRTVFATTTCVWQIDTSDIAGIIVMVRVELVPWPEGTSPKKTYLTPPETKRGVGLGREKGAFWTSHFFSPSVFCWHPMLAEEVWQGNGQKVEIIQTYAKGVKKGTENQQTKNQGNKAASSGSKRSTCRILPNIHVNFGTNPKPILTGYESKNPMWLIHLSPEMSCYSSIIQLWKKWWNFFEVSRDNWHIPFKTMLWRHSLKARQTIALDSPTYRCLKINDQKRSWEFQSKLIGSQVFVI